MRIDNYFKQKVISYKEIKGHFNQNFRVKTTTGVFHLKVFRDKSYEIRKWIKGTTITRWNEDSIKSVCQALRQLHTSNQKWKRMDYQTEQIANTQYQDLLSKYQEEPLVPCHNDLNKDNIIITSHKAFFIDYEFKRLNYKYWDIANIINEDQLGKAETGYFLKYYPDLSKGVLNDFIIINKIFVAYWKQLWFVD